MDCVRRPKGCGHDGDVTAGKGVRILGVQMEAGEGSPAGPQEAAVNRHRILETYSLPVSFAQKAPKVTL